MGYASSRGLMGLSHLEHSLPKRYHLGMFYKRVFGLCTVLMVLISSPANLRAAPINTYDNSFTVRVPDDWKATPKESFQHPGGLVLEINPPDVKSGDFGLRIYDKGESKMEGKKSPSLVLALADHDTLKKTSPENRPSVVAPAMIGTQTAYTFKSGPESSRWDLIYFTVGNKIFKAACTDSRHATCLDILGTINREGPS